MRSAFEKLFPGDEMSKRERVEATLGLRPVDRVALLEQLGYNPRVIAMYTGRPVDGFDYSIDEICEAIRATLDITMPPHAPVGTDRVTTPDGFVVQHDNWTSWRVSRPFADEEGAREWLLAETARLRGAAFDAARERGSYRARMSGLQRKIGETCILEFSGTGFCHVYDSMGLEIFSYFQASYPDVLAEYMETSTARELERVHAVADPGLSPVVLIPEDIASKAGLLFSPEFLREFHFPYVARLAQGWHEHGLKALYHSDGSYRKAIPDLLASGVDGFYCLEPGAGMDVVELKRTWPGAVWAGGVDGVDLMERGTPEGVRAEVLRQVRETEALDGGGLFVASSSEINPPIPAENFRAMIEAAGELRNTTWDVATTPGT